MNYIKRVKDKEIDFLKSLEDSKSSKISDDDKKYIAAYVSEKVSTDSTTEQEINELIKSVVNINQNHYNAFLNKKCFAYEPITVNEIFYNKHTGNNFDKIFKLDKDLIKQLLIKNNEDNLLLSNNISYERHFAEAFGEQEDMQGYLELLSYTTDDTLLHIQGKMNKKIIEKDICQKKRKDALKINWYISTILSKRQECLYNTALSDQQFKDFINKEHNNFLNQSFLTDLLQTLVLLKDENKIEIFSSKFLIQSINPQLYINSLTGSLFSDDASLNVVMKKCSQEQVNIFNKFLYTTIFKVYLSNIGHCNYDFIDKDTFKDFEKYFTAKTNLSLASYDKLADYVINGIYESYLCNKEHKLLKNLPKTVLVEQLNKIVLFKLYLSHNDKVNSDVLQNYINSNPQWYDYTIDTTSFVEIWKKGNNKKEIAFYERFDVTVLDMVLLRTAPLIKSNPIVNAMAVIEQSQLMNKIERFGEACLNDSLKQLIVLGKVNITDPLALIAQISNLTGSYSYSLLNSVKQQETINTVVLNSSVFIDCLIKDKSILEKMHNLPDSVKEQVLVLVETKYLKQNVDNSNLKKEGFKI